MNELIPLPSGYKNKEPSEIIRRLKEKVSERLREPGGHFYLGCALYNLHHNVKQAKSEFEKSIECDRNFLEGYKALTVCLLELKDDQGAEKILKRALKIAPKDTDILITYADLLQKIGKYHQAKICLTKALKFETKAKIKKIIQNQINKIEEIPKKIREIEVWTMARKDCYRSSFVSLGEPQEKMNITQQDYYSLDSPINPEYLPDIPCPIVAGEMVIFPDGAMKSFKGVKISSINEVIWKPGVLADRLTYSSTPVYVSTYLFFSLGNSIRRVDLSKHNPPIEPLVADSRVQMSPYCTPIAYENIVIFTFRECVYCYDLNEEKGDFISLDMIDPQDTLRSPVICNGELIILSQNGIIFIIDILTGSLVKKGKLPIKGIYSAPCVVGDNVYFEAFDDEKNSRRIVAYCCDDESIVVEDLKDELCSQEDIHLNFSPLVFGDAILVASDISSVFYQIRRIGNSLEIVHLELDIQIGHQRIVSVSHIFSTVLGFHLISKSGQGFFYVKLDDLRFSSINDLVSEMVTQPIVDKNRIYFLCKDGMECFSFEKPSQEEIG